MIVVAGVPRRGDKVQKIRSETWMGTDPTKRLFFRWLAVEAGEKWRREGRAHERESSGVK